MPLPCATDAIQLRLSPSALSWRPLRAWEAAAARARTQGGKTRPAPRLPGLGPHAATELATRSPSHRPRSAGPQSLRRSRSLSSAVAAPTPSERPAHGAGGAQLALQLAGPAAPGELPADLHADVAASMNFLAALLWKHGGLEAALPLFVRSVEISRELLGCWAAATGRRGTGKGAWACSGGARRARGDAGSCPPRPLRHASSQSHWNWDISIVWRL